MALFDIIERHTLSCNFNTMTQKKNVSSHHENVGENRRAVLKTLLGSAALATVLGTTQLAQSVLADEVAPAKTEKKVVFEYVESKLGIDYRKLAPSPLAEMLSQGEGEWMKNAVVDYEEDTAEAWKEELVPQIAKGAISNAAIENLRAFTPKMLSKFAVGLHPQDPKYGGLWSVGTNFVSEKLASTQS